MECKTQLLNVCYVRNHVTKRINRLTRHAVNTTLHLAWKSWSSVTRNVNSAGVAITQHTTPYLNTACQRDLIEDLHHTHSLPKTRSTSSNGCNRCSAAVRLHKIKSSHHVSSNYVRSYSTLPLWGHVSHSTFCPSGSVSVPCLIKQQLRTLV